MADDTSLAIAVAALGCVSLVALGLAASTVGTASSSSSQPSQPQQQQPKLRSRFSMPAPRPDGTFAAAPLTWDDDEGAWMLSLRMGSSNVELVLDSGSGQVSAKGSDCTWTQCDGDACTTTACPCKHDKDGVNCGAQRYVPGGRRLNPGEDGAGSDTVMTFGTQEDTVTHFKEGVSVGFVRMGCETLHAAPGRHLKLEYSHTRDIVVHLIHAIKGSSTSNICGVSRPMPGGAPVVLTHMLADMEKQAWAVVLFERGGWFAPMPFPHECFAHPPVYTPLVWPPEFHSFSTTFYVVRLKSLEVAGADAAGWKKVKRCPRFLVLDTGTTCTYAAPDLGQRMREAGGWKNEMSSSLRLVLDGGAVLTYTPKELKDPDDKTRSVFNCEPHTTLEDFSDIFSGIDAILFGAVMMRNMYWEYDLDKARVGMCKIIN